MMPGCAKSGRRIRTSFSRHADPHAPTPLIACNSALAGITIGAHLGMHGTIPTICAPYSGVLPNLVLTRQYKNKSPCALKCSSNVLLTFCLQKVSTALEKLRMMPSMHGWEPEAMPFFTKRSKKPASGSGSSSSAVTCGGQCYDASASRR